MSNPLHFNPSPDLEAQILEALTSEHHSLASIAALGSTSIEALTLWLARPATRDRVATTESTAAWRIRFTATFHLHKSIAALGALLDNPNLRAALDTPSAAPAAAPSTPPATSPAPDWRALHSRIRAAETIRKSAAAIIYLSRFKPVGPTAVLPTLAAQSPLASAAASTQTTRALPRQAPVAPAPASPAAPSPAGHPAKIPAPPAPVHPDLTSIAAHLNSRTTPTIPSRSAAALLQSAGSARAP